MNIENDTAEIENGSIGDSADILKEDSVGSGEQDEEEDDDVDDSEPRLKFSRIQNDLLKILEKDAVSCVAVHSKVRTNLTFFFLQQVHSDYLCSIY